MSNSITHRENLSMNWNEVYILYTHWKKDLTFYQREIQFLSNLVNQYYMWLENDHNLKKTETVIGDLKRTTSENRALLEKVETHLKHCVEILENNFSNDENKFREEHIALEEAINRFLKDYQHLKNEVFQTTEEMMESEHIRERMKLPK